MRSTKHATSCGRPRGTSLFGTGATGSIPRSPALGRRPWILASHRGDASLAPSGTWRLITTVKPQDAEDRVRSLITTVGDEELRRWEADVRVTIGRLLPKRRQSLLLTLEQRLAGGDVPPRDRLRVGEPEAGPNCDALSATFEDELRKLSQRHIYSVVNVLPRYVGSLLRPILGSSAHGRPYDHPRPLRTPPPRQRSPRREPPRNTPNQ